MRKVPADGAPLIRAAAWLWPLLSVLAVASGIAYAMDAQLQRAWAVATPADEPSAAPTESTGWVSMTVTTSEGARYGLRCLARPGFFSTERVTLDALDVHMITQQACLDLQAGGDAG